MKKIALFLTLLFCVPALADSSFVAPTALRSFTKAGITRDLTLATGSVAYTGFGFQPTTCFVNGQVAPSATQYTTMFGMVDSVKVGRSTYLATSQNIGTSFITASDPTTANLQIADVTSYDADGFTLAWTKVGAPTGTFTFNVMCYR